MDVYRFRVKPDWENHDRWFQRGRVYQATTVGDDGVQVQHSDGHTWSINHTHVNKITDPEPTLELHQSDIDALWSCPRRFYLQSVMGLQLKTRPSYFEVGEIYHYGLGCMRNVINWKNTEMQERFTRMETAINVHFEPTEARSDAMRLLRFWLEKEKTDPLPYKPLAVELPLTYRHPDWPPGMYIGGTLDAVLADKFKEDRCWIGEWKTATRADVGYFRSMKNGPQPAWYYLLLVKNLQHLGIEATTVRGHIYEIITKQKGEVKVESSILDETMFQRGIEFIGDSVARASSLITSGKFPRVLSSCYGKFNTECPFMPWCYRGGNPETVYDDLLASMYKVVEPMTALADRQRPIHQYTL